MKAFFIDNPGTGTIREIDILIPADDEILLHVKAAGLCGTVIHICKGEYFGSYQDTGA